MPMTLAGSDARRFTVMVWCIHPDVIPQEKIMYLPKLEEVHVQGHVRLLYTN
jgi:hypothetical protein